MLMRFQTVWQSRLSHIFSRNHVFFPNTCIHNISTNSHQLGGGPEHSILDRRKIFLIKKIHILAIDHVSYAFNDHHFHYLKHCFQQLEKLFWYKSVCLWSPPYCEQKFINNLNQYKILKYCWQTIHIKHNSLFKLIQGHRRVTLHISLVPPYLLEGL